jgi:hypothetical protein
MDQGFYRSREGIIAIVFFSIAIVTVVIHFVFFRFSFPVSNVDEATFLSPAYSLAAHGKFSSDVHASFLPGADTYTYWMPPLYMFLLGVMLKMFGITLFTSKLFSLLLILSSAVCVFLFSKDRYTRLVLVSLLLICPFIIITSARIRMEALAIFLILLSILSVKRKWPAYISGILAGLALMTHPMCIPCCAGLAFYNIRKGYKPFFIFMATAVLVTLPYLFYILQDIPLFRQQMSFQYARKMGRELTKVKLEYILQFVPTSILALMFVYWSKEERGFKYFFYISLTLTAILVFKSNEFNYQVYTIPYLIPAIGALLQEKKEKIYRLGVPALFFTFFLVMLIFKGKKNNNFQDDSTYYQLTGYLSQNKDWLGKTIFVAGAYNVSTYFLVNHQKVETINVVNESTPDWYKKFDYVVHVVKNSDDKKGEMANGKFWKDWPHKKLFTTSDGRYSLLTAVKSED